ncbi:MAG: crossover junction endodeoxyribonuclease RuvC [Candidatus Peribacteria bacterium]|nr:MAG: crossover junction endodeoxyribonuclease RuvC [Candidatus Peribacteria bacterium]
MLSTTPKIDIPLKLLEIGNDIKAIIAQYRPDILSIEKLYFTKNITTGIDVSQARGVVVYEAMKA